MNHLKFLLVVVFLQKVLFSFIFIFKNSFHFILFFNFITLFHFYPLSLFSFSPPPPYPPSPPPPLAFGEHIAETLHTPMLSAKKVEQLRKDPEMKGKMIILDSRPFKEYNNMCIPDGVFCGGGKGGNGEGGGVGVKKRGKGRGKEEK